MIDVKMVVFSEPIRSLSLQNAGTVHLTLGLGTELIGMGGGYISRLVVDVRNDLLYVEKEHGPGKPALFTCPSPSTDVIRGKFGDGQRVLAIKLARGYSFHMAEMPKQGEQKKG